MLLCGIGHGASPSDRSRRFFVIKVTALLRKVDRQRYNLSKKTCAIFSYISLKTNCVMTPHVRLSVGWLVGWSVGLSVIISRIKKPNTKIILEIIGAILITTKTIAPIDRQTDRSTMTDMRAHREVLLLISFMPAIWLNKIKDL